MAITGISSNYMNYYGANNITSAKSKFASISSAADNINFQSSQYVEDGVDDGKISTGSKIKNFFKGIGNTVKNGVKSLLTPKGLIKAALCVGACMIPGVGPFVALGLGAVGVAKGASTIIKGAEAASNAKTDAQAEAAWQNMGSGTFQVAVSAVAMKAGIKGLKANGGVMQSASMAKESISNLSKTAASKVSEVASKAGSVAKNAASKVTEAAKGATSKAGTVVENTASKVGAAVKDAASAIKENGVKATFEDAASKVSTAAKETASKAASAVKDAGVKASIKNAAGKVSSAVKSKIGSMNNPVSNMASEISATIKYAGLKSAIKIYGSEAVQKALSGAKFVGDKLSQAAETSNMSVGHFGLLIGASQL